MEEEHMSVVTQYPNRVCPACCSLQHIVGNEPDDIQTGCKATPKVWQMRADLDTQRAWHHSLMII